MECHIKVDGRLVYNWGFKASQPQTAVAFYFGNSVNDIWSIGNQFIIYLFNLLTAMWEGSDNHYYMERNMKRLTKWTFKVAANNNQLVIDGKVYTINFSTCNDYVATQSLFGELYEPILIQNLTEIQVLYEMQN